MKEELKLRNDLEPYKLNKEVWYYLEGKRGVSLCTGKGASYICIKIPLRIIKSWFR